MYISSDTPLLTGQEYAQACKAARARRCVDAAKYQMANGRAQLFETVISPETVAQTLGIPAAVNTKRLQDQSLQSRAAILAGQSGESQDVPIASIGDFVGQAPNVTPLNGSSIPCTQLTYVPRPMAADPTPVMPQPAPLVSRSPLGPIHTAVTSTPHWSNLCWALRNAGVDASQFDPAQLQALQWKCDQLGYTGACPTPPLNASWLDQGRRSGTLPHIDISQAVLDALPPAPPLTGVSCPQSWQMGGMSGLTGYSAPWSDAFVTGDGAGPASAGVIGWIQSHPWLAFGLAAGVGLVAASNRKKRGRK